MANIQFLFLFEVSLGLVGLGKVQCTLIQLFTHMKQMKHAMAESARKACGSVRVGGMNPRLCGGMKR